MDNQRNDDRSDVLSQVVAADEDISEEALDRPDATRCFGYSFVESIVEADENVSDEALDQPNGTPKSSNFSSVGKMKPVCPEDISDEALDRPSGIAKASGCSANSNRTAFRAK